MTASCEMPKYLCHKQVWALKIKTVAVHASGDTAVSDAEFQASDAFQGAQLIPVEDGYAPFHVSADWFRKHKPEAGGYYVVYEDGYKSYSPASAFESGYTPCAPGAITLPVVDPGPDSLEREIQAKANNGPRVTPDALKAEIVGEHYFTAADGVLGAYRAGGDVHPVGGTPSQATHQALGLLTFCVLVLRNGAKVVGINYGAIDPAQHSAERGRQEARAQAVDKVYELLGFRLRDELTAG